MKNIKYQTFTSQNKKLVIHPSYSIRMELVFSGVFLFSLIGKRSAEGEWMIISVLDLYIVIFFSSLSECEESVTCEERLSLRELLLLFVSLLDPNLLKNNGMVSSTWTHLNSEKFF